MKRLLLINYIAIMVVVNALAQEAAVQHDKKGCASSETLSPSFGVEGSFVIVAICRNGIILASDSRGNIFDTTDSKHKPVAYYDSVQKIFPVGSNAIAETGRGLISHVFFSKVVHDFSSAHSEVSANSLLPTFMNYCEKQYTSSFFRQIKKQKLFAAGYVKGAPTICLFNEVQDEGPFYCMHDGYIESDKTLLRDYATALPSLSYKRVAALAKKAIREYSMVGDRWKTIGGPISILLITPEGSRWIDNKPQQQKWDYAQDLKRDYFEGRVSFELIPPYRKIDLDELIFSIPDFRRY